MWPLAQASQQNVLPSFCTARSAGTEHLQSLHAHFISFVAMIVSNICPMRVRPMGIIPVRLVAVMLMRFGQVRDHVGQDGSDMTIVDRVAHVPPLPLRPQDAPGAQQPEVVRSERLRHVQRVAEVADAALPVHTGEHEAEAVRFAEQAEDVRQPANIVLGECQLSDRYI